MGGVAAAFSSSSGSALFLRYAKVVSVKACRLWVDRAISAEIYEWTNPSVMNEDELPPLQWYNREATGARSWWLGVV